MHPFLEDSDCSHQKYVDEYIVSDALFSLVTAVYSEAVQKQSLWINVLTSTWASYLGIQQYEA